MKADKADRNELFRKIFRSLLDYTDNKIIEKCAEWGLKTYEVLEQNGLVLTASDDERGTDFIYAITTAMIVGEFGNFCFDDNYSDENEIDLDDLGLEFGNIEAYVNEDTDEDRREELRRLNYLNIQDVFGAIQEWKTEIHKSLVKIHTEKGEKDPNLVIYQSLLSVFEVEGEDADIAAPYSSAKQEVEAYQYVSDGFQY